MSFVFAPLKCLAIKILRLGALLIWVESLQFLQEDVAVGHRVVRVWHDEEFEDGSSAGPQEQHRPVSVRSSLCVHHHLIQLVPVQQVGEKNTPTTLY